MRRAPPFSSKLRVRNAGSLQLAGKSGGGGVKKCTQKRLLSGEKVTVRMVDQVLVNGDCQKRKPVRSGGGASKGSTVLKRARDLFKKNGNVKELKSFPKRKKKGKRKSFGQTNSCQLKTS